MAIITISREMGSGGIPIAHKTAEKLGYTLIDGEAIAKVAPSYGLTLEALEKADEKPPAFVEKLDEQSEVDLHQIELIILDYALKGNVIIYGRGGQDLLKNIQSVLRVRVIAPFELRVERWAEREWLDPDLARVLVQKKRPAARRLHQILLRPRLGRPHQLRPCHQHRTPVRRGCRQSDLRRRQGQESRRAEGAVQANPLRPHPAEKSRGRRPCLACGGGPPHGYRSG